MRKLIFTALFVSATTTGAQGFIPAVPTYPQELCFEERCAPIRFTFLGTPEARYFVLPARAYGAIKTVNNTPASLQYKI